LSLLPVPDVREGIVGCAAAPQPRRLAFLEAATPRRSPGAQLPACSYIHANRFPCMGQNTGESHLPEGQLGPRFEKALRQGSLQVRHRFQVLIERKASRKVVHQPLHRNPRPPKTRRSRRAVGIYPNHFLQASKKFRSHSSNVQQPSHQAQHDGRIGGGSRVGLV
jgi:hypothetical protein